jgi:tetratricopeptide (TPR) repeat protein
VNRTQAEIEDLVRQFEESRWAYANWHHAEHLTIALHYVRRFPLPEAVNRMRDGIRRYNRIAGPGARCHETLTVAWMNLVSEFSKAEQGTQEELTARLVERWSNRWQLSDWYTRDRLLSDAALRGWVEPDLKPLAPEHGDPALGEIDTLWNFGDPAATEKRFAELLPKTWGPLRAELLTQIARTQGLQRRFDEALKTLDSLAADIEMPGYEIARIRWHLERGRTLNSSKAEGRGRADFERALALATPRHEHLAVDAAHMLGIVADTDESLEWNRRAIAMAEAAKDPTAKGWLGALYNNTGWTLSDKGDYAGALELFRRGLAWREEKKQPRELRIAKWSVAKMLRLLGKPGEALAMQEHLLKDWDAAGEKDGYVHEELGECLLALGRKAESKPQFRLALELLSKDPWVVANEAEKLARIKVLAG